ncbi:hypothetical protein Q7C36_015035 [Tachysurus vachellii]|uniref:Uncharacterized protein n=1 Tax=Tachysurus vachellii TaxID=175792 RepID=A0AA88MF79_TACVA|nr:hypothetical protein Q7C36_015035 [Tachysurus vachellii]
MTKNARARPQLPTGDVTFITRRAATPCSLIFMRDELVPRYISAAPPPPRQHGACGSVVRVLSYRISFNLNTSYRKWHPLRRN